MKLNTSVLLLTIIGVGVITQGRNVSENCFRCIHDTVIRVFKDSPCNVEVCGPFRMSKPYWLDGGKLTVNGEAIDSPTAFEHCALDYNCAKKTVQGYMHHYVRDCNGDGIVNCYDHGTIHPLGPFS